MKRMKRLDHALGQTPRYLRRLLERRERIHEHERRRALGMAGGEERAHGAALGDAHDRRALRPRGVEHGAQLVGALFERARMRDGIRQARPAAIDQDQPAERGEPASIAAKWGSSQTCSTCDTQPGTSTMSSAPSPTTW
jgi:hypothetical protein